VRSVAGDANFADACLDHRQAHDPAVQLVLRQDHLDQAEAALVIDSFQGGYRTLHVAEVAPLAGKTADCGLHRRRTQQGVACDFEPCDIE
jgi:hypothetical protein